MRLAKDPPRPLWGSLKIHLDPCEGRSTPTQTPVRVAQDQPRPPVRVAQDPPRPLWGSRHESRIPLRIWTIKILFLYSPIIVFVSVHALVIIFKHEDCKYVLNIDYFSKFENYVQCSVEHVFYLFCHINLQFNFPVFKIIYCSVFLTFCLCFRLLSPFWRLRLTQLSWRQPPTAPVDCWSSNGQEMISFLSVVCGWAGTMRYLYQLCVGELGPWDIFLYQLCEGELGPWHIFS